MIIVERLTKHYGATVAVAGLEFRVEPGEIYGFLGPNGAGKSTTLKILTGLILPTSGAVSVAGFDLATHPVDAKSRLGYVPETPKLYESLSADAFLDVMGSLHHLDPGTSRKRRGDLLELFGLADARHQRLRTFSKGMRQKVIIASALLHGPDVLMLDEPFDGLDASAALVMKGVLRDMANRGKTILFSSHILDVVERICTRLGIIDHGRLVAEGTVAEILQRYRASSLEEAFAALTGVRRADEVAADILAALAQP